MGYKSMILHNNNGLTKTAQVELIIITQNITFAGYYEWCSSPCVYGAGGVIILQ